MATLTRPQKLLLDYLVRFASNLEGGQLGVFTGLIGELASCNALGAKWKPGPDFDALGERTVRMSIKTRRKLPNRDRSPRMGMFRPDSKGKHNFDVGWYAELDERFKLTGVQEAPKKIVLLLQDPAGKRGISVSRFKKRAKNIWPG